MPSINAESFAGNQVNLNIYQYIMSDPELQIPFNKAA